MPTPSTTLATSPRAPLFTAVHPLGAARPDTLAALRAGVLFDVRSGRNTGNCDFAVLLVLHGGASQFDALALELGVGKAMLCRSLDRLELAGMVERRRDALDLRRRIVAIRTPGLARLNAIRDAMDAEVAL